MVQLIDKAAVVAEIEKRAIRAGLHDGVIAETREDELYSILSFLDSLEVKEMDFDAPALDNGNMPVERWKEACKAASCQNNYRNSHGFTKTCDDYFVDGVQWADEHPYIKEVDLEKEMDSYFDIHDKEFLYNDYLEFAKHFFELGLKVAQKGE